MLYLEMVKRKCMCSVMKTFTLLMLCFINARGTPCLREVGNRCMCNWKRAEIKCFSLEKDLDEVLITFMPNNVKYLTLRKSWANYPTTLTASHLERLRGIQELDLSFNFIEAMKPATFNNMFYLTTINLSNNKLRFLERNTFVGDLSSLKIIDLSNNQILLLLDGVLDAVSSLRHLDLRNNTLHHISNKAFSGLYNLRSLKLSNCKLNYFPIQALTNLTKLNKFELTHAENINFIRANTFKHNANLQHLHLQYFPNLSSRKLHKNAFAGLTHLHHLLVKSCNLTSVPFLKPLRNLQKLDLSQNPLRVIKRKNLFGLRRLKELILHQTCLKKIEAKSFSTLTSLESIDLSSNRLIALPQNIFSSHINEIKVMKIEENWWKCDCLLSWILQFNFSRSISQATCTYPEIFQGLYFEVMANITENCSAPTIKNPNSTLIEVFIGDNVTMTCLADGVPTPSVSWFKLNNETFPKQFSSPIFTILNASFAEKGMYRCQASNHIGVDFVDVYVKVKKRPWSSNLLYNGLLHFGFTLLGMFLLFLIVGSLVYHRFPQSFQHATASQ